MLSMACHTPKGLMAQPKELMALINDQHRCVSRFFPNTGISHAALWTSLMMVSVSVSHFRRLDAEIYPSSLPQLIREWFSA